MAVCRCNCRAVVGVKAMRFCLVQQGAHFLEVSVVGRGSYPDEVAQKGVDIDILEVWVSDMSEARAHGSENGLHVAVGRVVAVHAACFDLVVGYQPPLLRVYNDIADVSALALTAA